MKLERLALITALALSVAACAADRNKEVKSAEVNLTNAQQEARHEEARLAQEQAQERAEAQQKPPVATTDDRIELQTKQTEEQAEVKAEGAKEIAEADKDLADAHAAMQKDRTVFETAAKSRLTKADARGWEAKNKSSKVPADRRTKFNAEWNTFQAKKSEVQNRIGSLPKATNQEYKAATQKLEKALDDLDAVTQRLHDLM